MVVLHKGRSVAVGASQPSAVSRYFLPFNQNPATASVHCHHSHQTDWQKVCALKARLEVNSILMMNLNMSSIVGSSVLRLIIILENGRLDSTAFKNS